MLKHWQMLERHQVFVKSKWDFCGHKLCFSDVVQILNLKVICIDMYIYSTEYVCVNYPSSVQSCQFGQALNIAYTRVGWLLCNHLVTT